MTLEEAFTWVTAACRKYMGTAEDHELLHHSLKMIKEALPPFPALTPEVVEAEAAPTIEMQS